MNSLWGYQFLGVTLVVSILTGLVLGIYRKKQHRSLVSNGLNAMVKKYKPKIRQRIVFLLLKRAVENNTIPIGRALL